MNSKYTTVKIIGVAALSALMSLSAMAFQGDHGRHFLHELNLTDAQQTQLKSWREAHRDDRQGLRETMKSLQAKKAALLANYDAAQAQAIAEEEAQLHKARVLKQLEREQAIYSILDDEQKSKYQELVQRGAKKMKGEPRPTKDMPRPPHCEQDA